MGPWPVPAGGSRKPPALIHPRLSAASTGILSFAGDCADAGALVVQAARPVANAAVAVANNSFPRAIRSMRPGDVALNIEMFLLLATRVALRATRLSLDGPWT